MQSRSEDARVRGALLDAGPQFHDLEAWTEFVTRAQGLTEAGWYRYDELVAHIRYPESAEDDEGR
ncbi:hypothetical protein DMH25_07555 [Streptomyces sp. WAC 01325]|uniref:hypothetical protein n=1 Tax=Streptomyces sp. WAC 01325 TaxID=2203202 RepID=UPI000F88458C|nr:hypothetical protein [Streptomyces sp. WAC 01325]RSN14795.1 hypothetical protein DMH25_07555 [Streptomyces sp. WAC 01325]